MNLSKIEFSGIDTDKMICQECGKRYIPKRNDTGFCTTICRIRFNRKHTETWK